MHRAVRAAWARSLTMDFGTPFHSVVIVGCGISGLYAARLLRKRFPDLLCVEATDRIGGRIQHVSDAPAEAPCMRVHDPFGAACSALVPRAVRDVYALLNARAPAAQVEDFVSWPVQEGPEFVHGFTAPLRVRPHADLLCMRAVDTAPWQGPGWHAETCRQRDTQNLTGCA